MVHVHCAWPNNQLSAAKLIERKTMPNEIDFNYFKARLLQNNIGKLISIKIENCNQIVLFQFEVYFRISDIGKSICRQDQMKMINQKEKYLQRKRLSPILIVLNIQVNILLLIL